MVFFLKDVRSIRTKFNEQVLVNDSREKFKLEINSYMYFLKDVKVSERNSANGFSSIIKLNLFFLS